MRVPWTAEEDATLRDADSWQMAADRLPHRSVKAIQMRRHTLGLRQVHRKAWSRRETDALEQARSLPAAIRAITTRSAKAIAHRWHEMQMAPGSQSAKDFLPRGPKTANERRVVDVVVALRRFIDQCDEAPAFSGGSVLSALRDGWDEWRVDGREDREAGS